MYIFQRFWAIDGVFEIDALLSRQRLLRTPDDAPAQQPTKIIEF
jgi:hypothetical protein